MKQMIFRLAFIIIAIFALSSSSQAQVTFRFNVVIDQDNCLPAGYHGNYLVYCTIKTGNGTVLCSGQQTNINYKLIGQQVEVSFNCNISSQVASCDYKMDITVCRQTSPTPTCCSLIPFNSLCWSCLDGSLGLCDFHVSL